MVNFLIRKMCVKYNVIPSTWVGWQGGGDSSNGQNELSPLPMGKGGDFKSLPREDRQWILQITSFKVVANEDTMLWTHCGGHKCLPLCATFVEDTKFLSETQKCF